MKAVFGLLAVVFIHAVVAQDAVTETVHQVAAPDLTSYLHQINNGLATIANQVNALQGAVASVEVVKGDVQRLINTVASHQSQFDTVLPQIQQLQQQQTLFQQQILQQQQSILSQQEQHKSLLQQLQQSLPAQASAKTQDDKRVEEELRELKSLVQSLTTSQTGKECSQALFDRLNTTQHLILARLNDHSLLSTINHTVQTGYQLLFSSYSIMLSYARAALPVVKSQLSAVYGAVASRWPETLRVPESVTQTVSEFWAKAVAVLPSPSSVVSVSELSNMAQEGFNKVTELALQARAQAAQLLVGAGVPQEYVQYAVYGACAVAAALVALLVILLLKAVSALFSCRCCQKSKSKSKRGKKPKRE